MATKMSFAFLKKKKFAKKIKVKIAKRVGKQNVPKLENKTAKWFLKFGLNISREEFAKDYQHSEIPGVSHFITKIVIPKEGSDLCEKYKYYKRPAKFRKILSIDLFS